MFGSVGMSGMTMRMCFMCMFCYAENPSCVTVQ